MIAYSGVLLDEGGDGPEIPERFALIEPYPNPFNPSTTIEFRVPVREEVSLKIYDTAGRLIRVLRDGIYQPQVYRVVWDGTNESGRRVSSGVYYCTLSI